mgnify:CR=1 FL=1
MPVHTPERMQCMEVWGGNRPVDRLVQTVGLDVWMYSQPHANSQFGGDVCYISSCASGRITRILLADVSGHGEAVADRAHQLRSLMQRNINRINQSSLVASINQQFASTSKQGAFATALIGTYFAPTRMLTLSNAGHPSPLVFRSDAAIWQQFTATDADACKARNFPLGIEPGEKYQDVRTELHPGDLVLGFTDGLIEIEQADGTMLGVRGLLDVVSSLDVTDPTIFFDTFTQRLLAAKQGSSLGDDVSLLLIRRNDRRVSLRDNLLAPIRVVASLFPR